MKFKNKIFIIGMVLIILLCISYTSAFEEDSVLTNDTVEVLSSTDDVGVQTEETNDEILSNNEEDKLSDAGSFADLHTAIESHYGSTLVLENSYENNGNEGVISLTGDITIDGKGHTIDAKGKSGIFSIKGFECSLVLKNIIFKNAYDVLGGAVSIETKLPASCEIENCTFIQNRAENGGAAIFFSTKGTLEIKNSIFKSNYALYSSSEMSNGGAVLVKGGNLLVEYSLFEDNDSRDYGGAIYSEVNTDIIGCTFNRNYAVKGAGSVYMNDRGSFLTDSTFTTSSCEGDGGAVYSLMYLGVKNCSFIDCYASNNGGAIFCPFAVEFYDNHSVFINNRVSVDNKVYANKGGAIYAGTFDSDVNGIVFINNRAWYGGAIYINNENEVSFESCYFENNVAKNDEGTSGCGAAIYLDSSSSHLSLSNNIFVNNEAVDDQAVYNCGKYDEIVNNWWGVNTPNFDEPYLIEWHRIGSNDKHSDSNPLKISLTSDKELDSIQTSATLTVKFTDKDGAEFIDKLPQWDVNFSSNGNATFESKNIVGNRATVIYTPLEAGFTRITAKVNNQAVTLRMEINGDFKTLQNLVDNSDGVLNLTRNYTYSIGEDETTDGIKINKALKINGNGYTINALDQSRIFLVESSGVEINNLNFINGNSIDDSGGAVFLKWTGNILISNCNFTSNRANNDGGAIICKNYLQTEILIVNCSFTNNTGKQGGAVDGDQFTKYINCSFIGNKASVAGAVYFEGNSSEISGCKFINNYAERDGGAVYSSHPRNSIKDSIFIGNVAKIGGAIYAFRSLNVINSSFIENKASSIEILNSVENNILTLSLKGNENYINAIYADNRFDPGQSIVLLNVTYWNGEIVTGNNMNKSDNASGQNIILEIRDSNNNLVKDTTLKTDVNGLAIYDCSELEDGKYTFRAYHMDDEYYTRSSDATGNFKVTHIAPNPSSVTITTPDGKEFTHNYVHIDFTYENKTEIRVLITNYNGSQIFYDYLAGFNYVEPVLPASDEYYNITVFNIGNKTFQPSKDSIIFKVNKIDSTMKIDLDSLYPDILYNSVRYLHFVGDYDCHNYNVTIYDENNNIVHSSIEWVANTEKYMKLPLLNVGNYNVTVINLGNVNKNPKNQTASFSVIKVNNNFNVTVDDNVFGKEIAVTVRADVDGEYLVKLNSTDVTVNVVGGAGSEIVELGAGYYTANVTFSNANYNNNATNDTFTIQKAQSHVGIEDFGSVVLNQSRTIRFTDFYITKFNVTIYGEGNVVVISENTTSLVYNIPKLSQAGTYNITVINLGNENVTGSQASYIFNVDGTNNVEVIVDDADYGRELLIVVTADVDGFYTVNVNGTEVVVEVVDGIGFDDTLQLPAGDYYANATFDNPGYMNNIINTTFTIFRAESNLQIYEIGNVTYGADVVVRFYDDYPTIFLIKVVDSNGTAVMNATFEYEDKDPEMMVIFSGLDVGEYGVIIYNYGDENVIESEDAIGFNVTELPGTIIASDMTRGYNSGMDFKATLVDKNGTGMANVIVTFVINGNEYNAVTDANGVAIINAKLAVGTYVVDVINPYNDVLTTKNLKIVTRITENRNVNTYYGKNYQYKLRIIGDDGSPVGAGVAVKVTVNGKVQTLKTDKNGYITVKFTKNYLPKTYMVIAEYKGIKVSNKVVVKKVLTLKKVKVKRSAKKLVLTATLKEGKKAIKGKKLIFKFKGKKYTAKTNKKGVAKVTIKSKVLKKLKVGKKVKYQVTYLKNTVKRTVKVKR